jgi:predicted Zn-dependent protease with MMP-like domain
MLNVQVSTKISEHKLRRLSENILHYTIRSFPKRIRDHLEEVYFLLLKRPDPILHRDLEPNILGLFEGYSILESIPDDVSVSPQITIFYMNIWDYSKYRINLFHKQVQKTIQHEVGHYLGWEEDDLTLRGLD